MRFVKPKFVSKFWYVKTDGSGHSILGLLVLLGLLTNIQLNFCLRGIHHLFSNLKAPVRLLSSGSVCPPSIKRSR